MSASEAGRMTRSGSGLAAVCMLLAVLVLPSVYRIGLDAEPIDNGDEAIYVEMASEMIASGQPSELRFDGQSLFPRPPAAIWVLAAAYVAGGEGPPEPPLRAVNARLCGIEVALTILLGCLLFGAEVGIAGGALLACADLFVGYARVYESEPLLTCFVLGAFCAYAGARKRPWLYALYGALLAGALLTKQLVGLLPVLAPIVRRLAPSPGDPPPHRGRWLAPIVALAVALPWHVLMIARHGAAFVDSFFVRSLIGRAGGVLLHKTSPTFYARELVSSEGLGFTVLWLGAAVLALGSGLRRRRAGELLIGAWALGVLLVYSFARSRYDYYLLLAYPAFALGAAWLVARLSMRPSLRAAVALALVAASALLHLPRNLSAPHRETETRDLLVAARGRAPGAPLYTFNTHPYTARVYSGRSVRVFVDSPRDLAAAESLRATGMPAPAELASPPSAALTLARRPALLLLPRSRRDVTDGAPAGSFEVLGESSRFRLLYLP